MKKILACITAVALLMSFMPMVFAQSPVPEVIYDKTENTIKVTVKMPPVTGFLQAGVTVAFDPAVVSIDDLGSYAAGDEYNIGGTPTFVPNFQDAQGVHAGGVKPSGNEVTHAFMGVNPINKDASVAFAEFLFTIIDTTAAQADFTVMLDFFEDDNAVVEQDNGYVISTESIVINSQVPSEDPTEDPSEDPSDDPEDPGDTNAELAQEIKAWLESIGLGSIVANPTLSALIDELAEAMGGFGGLDFEEIIDSIVSGNFEDMPLGGILQGIIDTIRGLFGEGSTNPPSTSTTNPKDSSEDDTVDSTDEEGGLNGDNSPGDTGIALASAICLAAAAAFVIVKKKRD